MYLSFCVALGLLLHVGFLSLVSTSRGYSLVVVCGLLTAMASLVAEHGLWGTGSTAVAHRLSCPQARGIFPDQGLNPGPQHWQADF